MDGLWWSQKARNQNQWPKAPCSKTNILFRTMVAHKMSAVAKGQNGGNMKTNRIQGRLPKDFQKNGR